MARNIIYSGNQAYEKGYNDGYVDGLEEGRMTGSLDTTEKLKCKACKIFCQCCVCYQDVCQGYPLEDCRQLLYFGTKLND